MSTALVQPSILEWAIERSNITIDILANRLPTKTEKIAEWREGVSQPTFIQAQKLAKILQVPFGYFFLETPPKMDLPVPDLRTINNRYKDEVSPDLFAVITDVLRKQNWYRQLRLDQGFEELSFIGKYDKNAPTLEIAQDITKTLRLSLQDRTEVSNWEQFLNLLMQKAEEKGLWILRSGKVGSNTHRKLNVDEFRGFALTDSIAPAIFLNGTDAKAAQIFTLVHELVHLWIGESGISDFGVSFPDKSQIADVERKCNEVAAEILVPTDSIKRGWNVKANLEQNSTEMSRFFKVSKIVVARRALDTNLIDKDTYLEFYREQANKWRSQKTNQSPGGDYYLNIPIANGRIFTEAVLNSVYSQETLMRDGARLLGVTAASLDKLATQTGIS